ncbi:MAG: indole-3-glycerol phosphate synthase TrpC [Oscillospiraceae bacterium]|nr:indole-3-glycerol phosphate synthase TrpC [Ruminococcus sp.]MCD8346048.1 indole-3-glycerol phosphate synthase TrpC [Oscillospiraceae bacterium]
MILEDIARSTVKRVEKRKQEASEVVEQALSIKKAKPFYFEEKLREPGISFICEVKRASPSKGLIAPDFPYLEIARDYEKAGADAISVLTEPEFFMGSSLYLSEIRKEVEIPILRKDFTVDEYMIYEALTIGADAVLLICALLDTDTLRSYISIADKLGLSCIVEAHDETEVKSALSAGARIVGVNNRNLKDFTVDITNSARLRKLVPSDIIFISESGIKTRDDVKKLEDENVNAVLIGETFMRSPDKAAMLRELRGK